MKIYITDIFPSSLKNKLTTLKEYLVNQNGLTKYELASEDYGMHYIENDTIYRVEPNFKPDIQLIKKFLDNEILVDNTDYKMIPVVSQLPLNYVLTKIIDPLYELIPTYTGGKNDISFDEKYFYGCANSMIMKVDIETREIVDKIQHVNLIIFFFFIILLIIKGK